MSSTKWQLDKMKSEFRHSWAIFVALFLIFSLPAFADEEAHEIPGHNEATEHEYALQQVADGKALPLTEILLEVQKTVPGDLLEARLKMRKNVLVYLLTLLSKDGTFSVVTVNAKDKTILGVQEK